MESWILLWLIGLPFVGALICLPLPERLSKLAAVVFALSGVSFALALFLAFNGNSADHLQFVLSRAWIEGWGIHFAIGIDGLSLLPVLATKLMTPLAILSSLSVKKHVRGMLFCYLMLDAAVTGAFLATDLVLFYVCFEALLIPMVLLIGVWGGEDRVEAATKYFLLTFSCSICMLASILTVLAFQNATGGMLTADIQALQAVSLPTAPGLFGLSVQMWVVIGFTIAFLVKIPIFPLHPWLPSALGEAPVGGAAMLAAVLFQLGTYGLLRLAIPFGADSFRVLLPGLAVLAMIGIVYGACIAYQQQDFKRMIAYSTLSHLSYLLLGICTQTFEGLAGTLFHGFNHGLTGGALFLLAGMLHDRRRTTHFEDFGGLAESMPFFASALVLVAFSAIALPGLNGFVGEFLILMTSFQTNFWWGGVGLLGTILGAAFTLRMLKKLLFGKSRAAENKALKDLRPLEWVVLAPCLVLIVVLGVCPRILLGKIEGMTNTYWALRPSPPPARAGTTVVVPMTGPTTEEKQ